MHRKLSKSDPGNRNGSCGGRGAADDGNRPEVNDILKSTAGYRDIPIPPQPVACLENAKAMSTSEYVFTNSTNSEGEPMSLSSFKGMWAYIRRRSTGMASRLRGMHRGARKGRASRKSSKRVPKNNIYYEVNFNVTPHMQRHTYISELIIGGVDPKTVQYLAGHAKAGLTLDVYTHLMENRPEQIISMILPVFGPKEE